MRNLTITLDERTAAWVRVYAAKHNTSVSRIVSKMLRQRMVEFREYEDAMRRFLSKPPVTLRRAGERYPTRNALYDSTRLR